MIIRHNGIVCIYKKAHRVHVHHALASKGLVRLLFRLVAQQSHQPVGSVDEGFDPVTRK
jgi:hypothetical protein